MGEYEKKTGKTTQKNKYKIRNDKIVRRVNSTKRQKEWRRKKPGPTKMAKQKFLTRKMKPRLGRASTQSEPIKIGNRSSDF